MMNILNSQREDDLLALKQLMEGAVGYLKIVDPIHQNVSKCSAITINDNTVLTQARYVYDSSASSFFPQIMFTIGNEAHAYHVIEAMLIAPSSIT